MKDWEERLEALEKSLVEWNARYEQARARRARERFGWRRWLRSPTSPESLAIDRDARAEAGTAELEQAAVFLEELYGHYAEADVRERGLIRARVGAAPWLFDLNWARAEHGAASLRGSDDADQLRKALVAISIDDLRVDVQQLRDVLGRLHIAARQAGIDPAPVFAEVTAISNPGAAGGGAHLREFLEDFERSPYFRDSVQPLIAGRASA